MSSRTQIENNYRSSQTGLGYYGARYYNPTFSVWLGVDPLAMSGKNMSLTPYQFSSNNPVMRVDPDGNNDYIAYANGSITVLETNDATHSFYYVDSEGSSHTIGTWDKSSAGLVQPDDISYQNGDVFINITIKGTARSEGKGYFSGEALASLIGASAESGGEEIYVTGASLSDGRSPYPSKSHMGGKNFDMRYVLSNGERSSIDYEENPLDYDRIDQGRSATLNSALRKFGYLDIRTSQGTVSNGASSSMSNGTPIRVSHQLQGTGHLDDHYDHIHLQGYRPSVTRYDLRPLILPGRSLAPIR